MLFRGFKEADLVSKSNPGRIPLPDEDDEALKDIVHVRDAELPETLPFETLREFAFLVDKYNSADPVRDWSTKWLAAEMPKVNGEDEDRARLTFDHLCRLLIITFALDLWREFYLASLYLLSHTTGKGDETLRFLDDEDSNILPSNLLCIIPASLVFRQLTGY
jgi:hypothetical protein